MVYLAEIYVEFFKRSLPGFNNTQEKSKLKKTLYGLVRSITIYLGMHAIYLMSTSLSCSTLRCIQTHRHRHLSRRHYPLVMDRPDLEVLI